MLEFLIFRDVNDSGRTVVHHRACPYIGLTHVNGCRDNIRCYSRQAAASMRIGIVQKLRKGLENVSRRGIFEPCTSKDDPTRSLYDKNILL